MKLLSPLLAAVLLFACGEVKTTIDEGVQARIATVRDCFPELYGRVEALLEVAETWKLQTPVPDPPGLTWRERADGTVDVRYRARGDILDLQMRFYSPDGVPQDLDLGGAITVQDAVVAAAAQLQDRFGADKKFVVGGWTIAGVSANGAGVLTGIIGGTTTEPQLEELRTTTATPIAGPPPIADGTITTYGGTTCSLTFGTDGLRTDTVADQVHPIGTLAVTLVGPRAAVTGTVTFDGTSVATIVVDEVEGVFTYDSDTGKVTFRG